ncbi:hypothetical protein E2562_021583 [Oryza meyeriana var. granulata]|uniref:Uncharacterized protein n=1 Tax=Oryza meyeriana var. granulata TaxID=110450 RepID=A0A6G1EXX0_9ORYZ|nr:hypothetical protein E2562_021583 [Oryza meyeriana var. granulata]
MSGTSIVVTDEMQDDLGGDEQQTQAPASGMAALRQDSRKRESLGAPVEIGKATGSSGQT